MSSTVLSEISFANITNWDMGVFVNFLRLFEHRIHSYWADNHKKLMWELSQFVSNFNVKVIWHNWELGPNMGAGMAVPRAPGVKNPLKNSATCPNLLVITISKSNFTKKSGWNLIHIWLGRNLLNNQNWLFSRFLPEKIFFLLDFREID